MEKVKVTFAVSKESLKKFDEKVSKIGSTRAETLRNFVETVIDLDFVNEKKEISAESKPTNEIGIISDDKPVDGVFNSL